jgi:hypothetical protein
LAKDFTTTGTTDTTAFHQYRLYPLAFKFEYQSPECLVVLVVSVVV